MKVTDVLVLLSSIIGFLVEFLSKLESAVKSCASVYRGSPTYTKITNTVSTTTVFAYLRVSGGISVSRGPQYSPTNTNFK